MPFIGTGHIWIIAIVLVIVLIIWGPGKLPDVGAGMGRAIREFRKASAETREEFAKASRPEPAESTPVTTPMPLGTPTTVAQPAPVGGGVPRTPDQVPGEGDSTPTS